jgi:hypothetical protein
MRTPTAQPALGAPQATTSAAQPRRSAMKSASGEEFVLLGREGHDRESSLTNQRRIRKELVGLDLRKCDGLGKGLPCLDVHGRILGIGEIDRDDRRRPNRAFAVARLVNDKPHSGLHLPQIP